MSLQHSIPDVSRRVLTRSLPSLERDGLVSRPLYPAVRPEVEYRPTELAHELREPVLALLA